MNRHLTALLATGLATATAASYTLDGRTVFRRFGERQALERTTAAVLVGRATLAGPGTGGVREVPGRLDLTTPGQCRLKLELPEGDASATYASGKVADEGAQIPPMAALVALGCPLLVLRNVPASDAELATMRLAGHLGVDTSTVSLSRYEGHAAFVVGAHPRELERPQLWFDKESGRPVRVIGKYAGQTYDVRFEDPASLATNRRAPRIAEVWRGSERLLSLRLMTQQAENVQAGPATADEGDDEQD